MITRTMLKDWIVDAVRENRGSATYVEMNRYIWSNHENELRDSGDMFFTWQFDVRWAYKELVLSGILTRKRQGRYSVWSLNT